MKPLSALAAALVAATAALPALAALPTVGTPPPAPPSGGAGMLQALLGLVVVVALIFLLAWAARRMGLQRLAGGGVVKVVSSAAVGTRERVVVVDVAGTWLVLGVAPGRVSMLHNLPAQAAAPAAAPGEQTGQMMELFSSRLRQALGRNPSP